MESVCRLCSILLLFIPGILSDCRQEIAQDKGFIECMESFQYFHSDWAGRQISVICRSPEIIAAYNCLIGYIQQCPDIAGEGTGKQLDQIKAMTGFDLVDFFKNGGMEGACELATGPCGEVKNCIKDAPQEQPEVSYGLDNSFNYYYHTFSKKLERMCGDRKDIFDCISEKLSQCPRREQVEMTLEHMVSVFNIMTGIESYQDAKQFIQTECRVLNTETMKEQMACTGLLFTMNADFGKCADNIVNAYNTSKDCSVYTLFKKCITEYVPDTCSQESADFFIRNAYKFWPGIPQTCTNSGREVHISIGVILLLLCVSMLSNCSKYLNL